MGLLEGWVGGLEPGEGRPGFPSLYGGPFVLLGSEVLCVRPPWGGRESQAFPLQILLLIPPNPASNGGQCRQGAQPESSAAR